jgi:hypothetical protein
MANNDDNSMIGGPKTTQGGSKLDQTFGDGVGKPSPDQSSTSDQPIKTPGDVTKRK